MREQRELWPGGPLFAQEPGAPLGTDSVLLADFVRPAGLRRGIDLGCASFCLGLLLLAREEKLHMTGLELRQEAVALGEENLRANGYERRGQLLQGDIREHRRLFAPGSFDLVLSNPPYYPAGSGARSPDPARAAARSEEQCSLEELIRAASWLCRTGGRFALVHKPEQLSRVMRLMSLEDLEPKRLRLVQQRPAATPSLILVEGRKGGHTGLQILPPLILQDETGGESPEYRRIWHRE